MINVEGNYYIPSEGYKYLSNGEVWTDSIYLGTADDISNWHDTNDEPPDIPEEDPLNDRAEGYDILLGYEE